MHTQPLLRELRLEHQAILSFDDASGIQLACREGTVWVTLDGDPRDFVLEPGETFQTRERRRVIVYALQPSRVGVTSAGAGHEAAPRGLQIDSAPHAAHA